MATDVSCSHPSQPASDVGRFVRSFVRSFVLSFVNDDDDDDDDDDDEVGSTGGVDTTTARSRASTENMGVFWVKVRRRTFALSFRQTSFKKKIQIKAHPRRG